MSKENEFNEFFFIYLALPQLLIFINVLFLGKLFLGKCQRKVLVQIKLTITSSAQN